MTKYVNKNVREPKLFKTGFLSNTNKLREKQGLLSQELCNLCQNLNICNNTNMYPFPVVQYDYGGSGVIQDTCLCTQYIKSP